MHVRRSLRSTRNVHRSRHSSLRSDDARSCGSGEWSRSQSGSRVSPLAARAWSPRTQPELNDNRNFSRSADDSSAPVEWELKPRNGGACRCSSRHLCRVLTEPLGCLFAIAVKAVLDGRVRHLREPSPRHVLQQIHRRHLLEISHAARAHERRHAAAHPHGGGGGGAGAEHTRR